LTAKPRGQLYFSALIDSVQDTRHYLSIE
jgi:hypothetical protein